MRNKMENCTWPVYFPCFRCYLGDWPIIFFTRSTTTPKVRCKRVFNIDIEICERCGGKVKVIAEMSDHSIEDPVVIAHILKQLKQTDALTANAQPYALPQERSPPQSQLFDKPY